MKPVDVESTTYFDSGIKNNKKILILKLVIM